MTDTNTTNKLNTILTAITAVRLLVTATGVVTITTIALGVVNDYQVQITKAGSKRVTAINVYDPNIVTGNKDKDTAMELTYNQLDCLAEQQCFFNKQGVIQVKNN